MDDGIDNIVDIPLLGYRCTTNKLIGSHPTAQHAAVVNVKDVFVPLTGVAGCVELRCAGFQRRRRPIFGAAKVVEFFKANRFIVLECWQ